MSDQNESSNKITNDQSMMWWSARLSGSRWSQDMGEHAGMYEIDREIWALVLSS